MKVLKSLLFAVLVLFASSAIATTYTAAAPGVSGMARNAFGTGSLPSQAVMAWKDAVSQIPAWQCSTTGETWGTMTVAVTAQTDTWFAYSITHPATPGSPSGACSGASTIVDTGNGSVTSDAPPPLPELPFGSAPVAGMCQGNPILPSTAEKYRSELDWSDSGPSALSFVRTYRSSWARDSTRAGNPFGQVWSHSFSTKLIATPAPALSSVAITTGEGYVRIFEKPAGATIWTATDSADTLTQPSSNAWTYHRADDDSTLNFDGSGKLQSEVTRNGWTTAYTYNSSDQLASVTNGFGRTLALAYNGTGQLTAVTTPDARVITYGYDGTGRLSSVTYPDGKVRSFVYENASFPQGLTGILDESGSRWGTFAYDSTGRAVSTQLAGSVDSYQVSYPSTGSATVVDPLGTSRNYSYSTSQGKLAVTSGSLPSGDGTSDAASRVQDANGLTTSETDFKGTVTTTSWDTVRRLPLTVVRASGKPEAQIVTTSWHPTFSLPALITEAGRTTAYTYDARGNLLTLTVTDTSASPNTNKSWNWTYNAQQLIETATKPNGATSSYTYDSRGNVLTSINALGHVTSYAYDDANRVVSTTAPNGLVTTYTYDARDRLLTQTIGGQTTTITYKPYGTVEAISLPTGLVLTYTYDAAHRLIGWSNSRGESGTYTLDGMGNRTAEQIKNSAGNVAWSVVRAVNNINRLSARTEGPNQTSTFGYDANGELISATNGLNQSTQYGLDSLRRISTVTDPINLPATFKYNALDAITEAKDFKGVVTAYTRDAQGNAITEASADVGSTSTQYDNLGLPRQIIDALGQATTITRDALGRPTSLVFADGKTTTLRYDLTANSKGYLSEIVDRSGTTAYTRDALGRITLKTQTLINGSVQQVSYGHNPNGTLASIGYPNNLGLLTHFYDGTGRLTGLNLNGTPLVTNVAWNPLGQPIAWTWAFTSPSVAASRVYDTAGRLTTSEFSGYAYDAAGRISSLTQNLYQPGDADPTHGTIANSNVTWTTVFSNPGRLRQFDAPGNTLALTYDNNGNRATSVRVLGGKTTSRTYSGGAASNQLTGFTQSINGASTTSVTYGYNANGDLLTDGLRSYTYDAEGRLVTATTGATDVSPTTRYAHNALGQRVFKTEPLYPPVQGDSGNQSVMDSLVAFFTKLWSPSSSQAEQMGYAYVYDEQGTLIAEVGSGGAASAGQTQYIYLPTANGPMPIAAVLDGATYAVHSDHLNTPRRLTNAGGQAVWQWSYSAFGEDKPTVAKNRFANLETTPNPGTTSISEVKFNLRYPGQYADEESGLFYNGFRTYDPRVGRYTQGDPIGLDGGWNRFSYVDANPMSFVDPEGLAGGPPRSTPRVPLPGGGAVSNGLLSGIAEAMRGSQAGAAGARAMAGAGSGRGTINPPLPDSAYVCRGGLCTADRFAGGSGVTIDSAGKMCRASVNSAAGKSVQELSTGIPNPKMGVTTVGDVRRLGGDVVPDPTPKNPDHCLMCGITPAQAERLFTPVVPNPNR